MVGPRLAELRQSRRDARVLCYDGAVLCAEPFREECKIACELYWGGIGLGNGGRLRLAANRGKAMVLRTLGFGPGLAPPGVYHGPLALGDLRAQWLSVSFRRGTFPFRLEKPVRGLLRGSDGVFPVPQLPHVRNPGP